MHTPRTRTIAAAAACLLAVPAAHAAPLYDDFTSNRPAGDDYARSSASSTSVAPRGDDHFRDGPTASVATPVTSASDGFDWQDAGAGFGAATGMILLIGGSLVAVRLRQRPIAG